MKFRIGKRPKKISENPIIKIYEAQKLIHEYIREGKDLSELEEKGIRLVTPDSLKNIYPKDSKID
ncbi:MAG TPA: hypothetical protein VE978_14300 [Chitinophagales bacterium]|nr:hypothetical protein [Chitinophagales bacterium]